MPSELNYADVEIRILKQEPGKGYPVEIRVDGLRHYPRGYLQAGSNPPAPGDAHYADQTYGEKLFEWFFADPQLALNWAEIRGADRPRRIRLFIDADESELAELHRWPWEALWEPPDAREPARPLAADTDTPFSRYLAVNAALARPILRRPVRILVAAPRQIDFEEVYPPDQYPDMAVIDPDSEFRALQEALQPLIGQGAADMRLLPQPVTLAAIADELSLARAEDQGYHILHLISHGLYRDERTYLLLADADNRVQRESDQRIVPLLRQQPHDAEDENTLRLVFLASCETAKRSSADAFRGLAPNLVGAGLPAVVAMQAQVGEQTARQFAVKFYQQLLRHGQVDLAANEARQILLAARLPGPVIPVLFMRLSDGQLFSARPNGNRPRKAFEPEMVFMSAGSFRVGRDPGPGVPAMETPAAAVTLAAYRIGKYPVTNAEYLHFVRATGRAVVDESGWTLAAVGRQPSRGQENHPVVGVTWDDAVAYCDWLKETTGRSYRLPSEAEWEHAARGIDGRLYPWGNDFDVTCCNAQPAGMGATTPVGHFSPAGDSPRHCADMAGNVWEWTNTQWGREAAVAEYPYPYTAEDGRENRAALAPFRELRICRGGSFADGAERVTCTARARYNADSRHVRRGFRVAMDV